MYIYCILHLLLEEYAVKRDHWCSPYQRMTAITFSDAKKECSENVNCHMFFSSGSTFYSCENTASIKFGSGNILYQKQGNNQHTQLESFRVILLKVCLVHIHCVYMIIICCRM